MQDAASRTPLPGTPTARRSPGITPEPGAPPSSSVASRPGAPPSSITTQPGSVAGPICASNRQPARGAAKGATAESVASAGRRAAETAAAERLDIAQAKIANNLLDLAIADLRQIVLDYPNTRGRRGRGVSRRVAARTAWSHRRRDSGAPGIWPVASRTDPRAPDSKLRLADLTLRSRRPNRELAAREVLSEIVRDNPRTPQALQALNAKMRIETDRRLRERDPVLGIDVPAVLVTERTLTEQFPTHPSAMIALNRLAERYMEINQYRSCGAGAHRSGDALSEKWRGFLVPARARSTSGG